MGVLHLLPPPQSPVNLLARLEPAAIWSDGLFMEPGGGPGSDPANLEAISGPGWGAFGVLISRSGPPPQPPHPAPPRAEAALGVSKEPPFLQGTPARICSKALSSENQQWRDWATHRPGCGGGVGTGVGGGGRSGAFQKETSCGIAFRWVCF